MTTAANRRTRGFTMMELLVALGILAVALASVLSIFARGSQFGLKAQERMEAARVAQAVFDLVDRGFIAGTRKGRDENGNIAAGASEVLSQDIEDAYELDGMAFSAWSPAYVIRSHLDLVWSCQIDDYVIDGITGMHLLKITVRFDSKENGEFDELLATPESGQPDRLIGRYYAVLADRQVTP